jgi:regulator of replication initiation timing
MLRELLQSNLNPIKEQLGVLQNSVSFISDQYDDMKNSLNTVMKENKELKTECTQLRATTSDLTDRLNSVEQYMRDSNIELQGIPENKSENIANIVKQVAQVVSIKLTDVDILSCTRVAPLNKKGNRPRNIVVKLRSNRCRDELYSAVTRYNKAHRDDKLNTSHLGIAGNKIPVYVCEHLSPTNKALHAGARIRARELGYKFVWVRNGHIFMRRDETSRFIHVKNEQTLSSLE